MKICILGKRGSIISWVEGAVAGLRAAGHDVLHAVFRDPRMHPAVDRLLFAPAIGAPRAGLIVRRISTFAPDVIIAIDAFSAPLSLLERLHAAPGLPPLLGWVGDTFGDYAQARAPLFAAIAYTDSGLLARHRALGLAGRPVYLPHAANARLAQAAATSRSDGMVFVGNPTPRRIATLAGIAEPVAVYGPGWTAQAGSRHEIHAGRVPIERVAELYRQHRAALNIRNEQHVLAGLNQRNFDPYLCGAAVLTDAQPDLESCFEPGDEVLVYRDLAELNALHARLRREPDWAQAIARRGLARVLRDHTYDRRLRSFAELAGARVTAPA